MYGTASRFLILLEQKQRKTLPAAQMEINIQFKEMLTRDDTIDLF